MLPDRTAAPAETRPRIVIVGAGFAGLACARVLANAPAEVTVIDRRNHNLFQPLLYQVATAALSPADVSEPIRRTLARARNVTVILGEATGVDLDRKTVSMRDAPSLSYDTLVLAMGSQYNYFGHDDWRDHAPGLKTVHEARLIRHRLLSAFERAERMSDPRAQRETLTFVIVGAGPTGVEMAGSVSELGRSMIGSDFRNLSPAAFRVVLIEAGPRILPAFPENLAAYAKDFLENLGVDVRLETEVLEVGEDGIVTSEGPVPAGCVVWAAGVRASPAADWLGVAPDRQGRVKVSADLSLPGHPDVFVLGDTAHAADSAGEPLPALAQVAKQQGTYLGRRLRRQLQGKPPGDPFFRFHNRGNTAVIGRNAAIFDFGRWTLKGRFAWLLWAIVHVLLLVNFEKRMLVSLQWIWRYATRQRGARLIDEDYRHRRAPAHPRNPAHGE
ncbi:NAD(P)/FAD-dependent oxidoreductase [Ensifer soli]|uniref:NAD(P)/FAD-dependent oxidoreductase n=1 Tax=Ciceribacter sp. sgz301302 TaxID=3342379 RepID=UPI0035B9E330